MMKNMRKRILVMLLCIVMCVSLLPVPALAEEGTIISAAEAGQIIPEEDITEGADGEEEIVSEGEIFAAPEPLAAEVESEEDKDNISAIENAEETSVPMLADAGETVTLSFDGNGGSGAPASMEAEAGENGSASFTIPSDSPKRDGYTFQGWAKSADATKAAYKKGDTFETEENATLYAVWKQTDLNELIDYISTWTGLDFTSVEAEALKTLLSSFGINDMADLLVAVFDNPVVPGIIDILGGDSSGSTPTISFAGEPKTLVETEDATEYSITYTTTIDISALIPSILKYFTAEEMTLEVTLEMDSRLTPGSDITIESGALTGEATVDGNTVTVTLTGENIDGSALATPVVFTCTGTLSAEKFDTTEGNNVITTTAQLTDASVTISGTMYTTEKVGGTLTAETDLEALVFLTLTYDANGGSGAPGAETKQATVIAGIKNAKFTIPATEPTRNYYSFKGWAEEKDATTAKYRYGLDSDLTIHKDTTLYAVWEQSPTYTLYFNANGGEDAPEPQSGISDENGAVALTIPSTRPTRTGYRFLGWGTSRVGSAAFQPGDNVTIRNGDVTLYAIWQREGGGSSAIRLNKTELTLIAGKSEKLIVTDGDGNRVNASWSSTDNDVATINSDGTVAAKKAGRITITATYNGASASCQVRVLFKDVTDYSLFYFDAVYNMVDQGVIGGYNDGTFRPNGNCNRAAVVTFLWRLAKCPEPETMVTFSDMPTNNEDFCKAISWAAEQGITTGYAGNLFKPWATCNRAAIVTFLWRYAGKPEAAAMATFKDMPTDNEDFCKAISWAAENGITTGWDDNTFRPWNTCNRLAVASFLDRYTG